MKTLSIKSEITGVVVGTRASEFENGQIGLTVKTADGIVQFWAFMDVVGDVHRGDTRTFCFTERLVKGKKFLNVVGCY